MFNISCNFLQYYQYCCNVQPYLDASALVLIKYISSGWQEKIFALINIFKNVTHMSISIIGYHQKIAISIYLANSLQ